MKSGYDESGHGETHIVKSGQSCDLDAGAGASSSAELGRVGCPRTGRSCPAGAAAVPGFGLLALQTSQDGFCSTSTCSCPAPAAQGSVRRSSHFRWEQCGQLRGKAFAGRSPACLTPTPFPTPLVSPPLPTSTPTFPKCHPCLTDPTRKCPVPRPATPHTIPPTPSNPNPPRPKPSRPTLPHPTAPLSTLTPPPACDPFCDNPCLTSPCLPQL